MSRHCTLEIPYDFKKDHPKFSGLNKLIEMYTKEGEGLSEYIKTETKRLNDEISAENKALLAKVEWVWKTHIHETTTHNVYRITATPLINGDEISDSTILNLVFGNHSTLHDDSTKDNKKWGFRFRILNSVMLTDPSGYCMHYVDNGTLLEDWEISLFQDGEVPPRFQHFGNTPKS